MLLVKTQTQKPNSQKQLKCSYNLLKSALTRLRSLSKKKKKKLTNFLLDWVKKLTTAFTSDRKEIASGFWTLSFSLSFCRAGKTTWGMCIIIIMADIQTYMHGWANGDLTRHYALKVRFFYRQNFHRYAERVYDWSLTLRRNDGELQKAFFFYFLFILLHGVDDYKYYHLTFISNRSLVHFIIQ